MAEHDLLLRAALGDGAEAVDAWRTWRSRTNVDDLDPDSQWLLPQLYVNLRALGVPALDTARYRNVYRHNWYKNQLMLRDAEAAIDALARAGRRPVVLGGAAMALRRPDVLGARPFVSVDVLAAGAVDLRRQLHGAESDAILIARTITIAWRHRRWLVLDPVAQLVDACLRRADWDPRSRLLWVADVATLVRRDDCDWDDAAVLATRMDRYDDVAAALAQVEERLALGIA